MMITADRLRALAGAAALCFMLGACAPVYQTEPILEPLNTSDPQLALGERVFAAECSQCHPNAFTGVGPGIADRPIPGWAIRFQVRNGFGQMPAFSEEEISDRELDAVIAYIDAVRARAMEAAAGEAR